MSETIEQICLRKGVKLTDQRKIIAKVLSESKENYGESDHPDVDELYKRVSKIDSRVSIATVYRTVKLFEESGILEKHDFKGGKARYEQSPDEHHDHLIDINSGEIIEFVNEEIEELQKKDTGEITSSDIEHAVRRVGTEVMISPITDNLFLIHALNIALGLLLFGLPFSLFWVL